MNNISVYQYIAANDPYGAKSICNKYSYQIQNVQTTDDVATCLEQLVAQEGEPAFKDLMALHPDRDIITELYGTQLPSAPAAKGDGGCKDCGKSSVQAAIQAAQQNTGFTMHQGNTFLFAGVLILAVAIVATSLHAK